MAERFARGGVAYAKDGKKYRVDDVEDGTVYCSSPSGAETEFAAEHLLSEAEWESRSARDRDKIYGRLKLSDAYTNPGVRLDKGAGERVLAAIGRLMPELLGFAAYQIAADLLQQGGDGTLVSSLSVAKCRAVFDEATLDVRIGLLARVLGVAPKTLIDAGQIGDNLMRAILAKGIAAQEEKLAAFRAGRTTRR
jgi:hypothetical protein